LLDAHVFERDQIQGDGSGGGAILGGRRRSPPLASARLGRSGRGGGRGLRFLLLRLGRVYGFFWVFHIACQVSLAPRPEAAGFGAGRWPAQRRIAASPRVNWGRFFSLSVFVASTRWECIHYVQPGFLLIPASRSAPSGQFSRLDLPTSRLPGGGLRYFFRGKTLPVGCTHYIPRFDSHGRRPGIQRQLGPAAAPSATALRSAGRQIPPAWRRRRAGAR
jgi:hypothetical protein